MSGIAVMKVGVIGSGYVGLVAGACLAETGNDVVCADIDEEKIAGLKVGKLPIYEPSLDTLVDRNQAAGRLNFTTDVAAAVRASDVIFIAVGTPPGEGRVGGPPVRVERGARHWPFDAGREDRNHEEYGPGRHGEVSPHRDRSRDGFSGARVLQS